MERLISIKEVCVVLNMHRSTVYRKIKLGEIDKPLKDGRRKKFKESHIIKYQQGLHQMNAA